MAHSFLQSRAWEEFQKSVGRKTWRVSDEAALVIRHELPMGMNYLYCPRPDAGIMNCELGIRILESVAEIAKNEKSIFLKIDPAEPVRISGIEFRASKPLQPRQTVIMDLQKSEDELLSGMHEKTRYNVRLAERRGVCVKGQEMRDKKQGSEVFWNLLRETAQRDGFRTHERSYYEKLLEVRDDEFSNELFFAEHGGKILAAALVNFYGPSGAATYLHGASSGRERGVMAPYALHWRIARAAKSRGFAAYDLWGIDEKKWSGITRFKRGFGGQEITYAPPVEIVYRPFLAGLYRVARWFR